ncbi:Six-hairpin glycosidase [Auriculariales sp. MPI-PUGE-AT-0066]|nr:Six-hairpin glycosidase [Auriculariales sp. MPI-PUGE-AT-0066]
MADATGITSDQLADHQQGKTYLPIASHAIIGNMRTAALISIDGSLESYCVPNFDSPSVFARILDRQKGGHFSINPSATLSYRVKQSYLPNSNILATRYFADCGVALVTDFMPRPHHSGQPLLEWVVRKVEVLRGRVPLRVECAPAFDYARASHTMTFKVDATAPVVGQQTAVFSSSDLTLDLRYVVQGTEDVAAPSVELNEFDLRKQGHKGTSVSADFELVAGQSVTFILRVPPVDLDGVLNPRLSSELVEALADDTVDYWHDWIAKSRYHGRWRENVERSALALKLLTFEPTGAIVAAPTFSLPEYIGGQRNWDYRYTWIRDSAFTMYALLRLGFSEEADAYLDFVFNCVKKRNEDGSLNIVYSIHGDRNITEETLDHLEGHACSRPVRIGNGAVDHIQLDIYGELLDAVYLSQKWGKPLTYEQWRHTRSIIDYVVEHYTDLDLSIWEPRGAWFNYTYSKVMMWVAMDRALRIADEHSLPVPRRQEWLAARDTLYDLVQDRSWNAKEGFYGQSFETNDVLDSAVCIMPLVFFASATDDRFISTLDKILAPREQGGLMTNGLIYRYDTTKVNDGVGGEEGTFCLCTLWAIEALARVGRYDPKRLKLAVRMFDDFLQYSNHVGLCTEEIGPAGEGLGNAVQAFTHVTLISTAFNLSRELDGGDFA